MVYISQKYEIAINLNKHKYSYDKILYDGFTVNIMFLLTSTNKIQIVFYVCKIVKQNNIISNRVISYHVLYMFLNENLEKYINDLNCE